MQSSFTDELRKRVSILVRQIRAISRPLRQMWRGNDRVVAGSTFHVGNSLSDNLDSVGERRLQATAVCSITENDKRQLESGIDHPNTAILSGDSSILRESRGSRRIESSQAENIGTGQGGIVSVAFLHLGIQFEGSQAPDRKAIETVLNKAKDWYRYAPNCWIIYTSRDADYWYEKLALVPGMKNHASLFICELDLHNRSGWMPIKFWEWIKEQRS